MLLILRLWFSTKTGNVEITSGNSVRNGSRENSVDVVIRLEERLRDEPKKRKGLRRFRSDEIRWGGRLTGDIQIINSPNLVALLWTVSLQLLEEEFQIQ